MVQVSSFTKVGKIKGCRVHDLLHEIIREKNEDLRFCHSASDRENLPRRGMIRRLTIASGSNNLMGSVVNSNIRSLHVFSDEELSESSVKRMPTKYRLLRVLHFEGDSLYNYVPLTENFQDLSLLTYLSLKNSKIENLPKSIGLLHNLETLDLRQSVVGMMPREFYKLKKLRHLLAHDRLFGLFGGLQMEGGIGVLTSLQTLRDMDADHDAEEVMKELERLTQLRVLGLTNVREEFTSSLCSLINKLPKLEVFHVIDMSDEFKENFHLNRGQRQWRIGVLLFLC